MKVVVVSYKSNSSDFCMGCHVESYDSDLCVGEFTRSEKAAEQIATLDSKRFSHGEDKYEHHIFVSDPAQDERDWDMSEEDIVHWKDGIKHDILSNAAYKAKVMIEQRENQERIVQQQIEEKKKTAEEAAARKVYEALKQRFK